VRSSFCSEALRGPGWKRLTLPSSKTESIIGRDWGKNYTGFSAFGPPCIYARAKTGRRRSNERQTTCSSAEFSRRRRSIGLYQHVPHPLTFTPSRPPPSPPPICIYVCSDVCKCVRLYVRHIALRVAWEVAGRRRDAHMLLARLYF